MLPLARAWRHPLEMGLKEGRDLVSLVPCGTLGSKTGKFTGHQNTISPLSGAIPGPRRGGLTLSPSEVIPMEWPLWWWPFNLSKVRRRLWAVAWPFLIAGISFGTLASCPWGEGGSQFACPPQGVVFLGSQPHV